VLRIRRDRSAIPALQRLAETEGLPGIARFARSAVEAIQAPVPPSRPPDELGTLRDRLAELEKENAELKARLDRLEKR